MRHFQSILFVLCILAGISSCNTISDEWQNFVSSGLSDSTEVHTCTLYLDAARPSFDEKESGNTRASGGRWEDGDVVYLRISESVYGQGVYSARNSTWTFEYVGSINASEGDCQTFYLGGYQNFDKFSTKIYVNEHTSIYGDTRAKYKYMNGALYLTSNLAPTCCRMRMKGLEDSQKVTIREDENLVFFESMNLQEGTFSLVSKDVVISDVGNSYTEYVYLSSAAADPILTLVSEGKAYRRTLSAKYFSVGESGVLNVPTLSSHFGWDEVLCVAKLVDGLAFNESIKRLANGDDIKEDKYLTYPDYTIQEIVFDCGSNVSSGTLVSSMDSDVPIYANYSNGVIVVSTIAQMIETFTLNRIFDHCHSLISVDLSNLDTHSVTDMNDMFRDCESLTNLDLSNFDTHSVTDMSGMFVDCESLTNLDLSNFDTHSVTDMSCMFGRCKSLTNLDVSNFDTRNVTNMDWMFGGCESLTNLDVSNFDTHSVTDMHDMFTDCESLTNLDVSNFDTHSVTDMHDMFTGCESLTNLDVSNFDTRNVTDMLWMFDGCESLTNLDVSNFDTRNVTDMHGMFGGCESLTNLDLSNFDTRNVTNMGWMFNGCESLTNLDLSNFNTRNVTDMYGMFDGCINVTKLKLGNCFEIKFESHSFFGDMSSLVGSCSIYCSEFIKNELIKPYVLPSDLKIDWIIDAKAIIEGSEFNKLIKRLANGENRINHFLDEDNVIQEIIFDCGSSVSSETIVSTWDSDVPIYANYSNGVVTISTLANYIMPTSMNAMFAELRSLRSIDLRCFDTRNVRNMGLMFNGCKSLTNLDVSNFDTRNVEYMWDMFFGCSSLTSLDLTSFDTRNVTFIDAMFLGCSNLSSLNLSNFDIRNVTNLYAVFADCTNLTYLDLSNVDTSNVTNMDHLFSGCSRLSSLNLGPLFVINENVDTSEMFAEACSQAGSCSVSCLEATKKTIQNSTRFPTDVSFTWNILDN